jgi:hypothetical protein
MTFTVSDGAGNANSQTVTVRIDPLVITTSSLPNAPLAVAYNAQLTATGLTPVTWTLAPGSSLPAGLTLNSNGSITGTPTAAQSVSFYVRATDPAGQVAQRSLSIYVFNP